jgi:ankyrin repeat protein
MRLLRRTEQVPRFRRARQAKALIDAVQYGDSELALWFLKHGFDPNAKDNKGRSALWWAAALCKSNAIRELVRRSTRLPDDVLMGPVVSGHEKIVRFLLQRGGNVNCVASTYSPCGWHHIKQVLLTRALATAAHDQKLQSIPIMLVRAGAQVNRLILPRPLPGSENRSMLGLAAYYGLLKTVEAMIVAGADVNLRDNRGRTALFDALEQDHLSVAKELLRAGARTDLKDCRGMTPAESLRQQQQSPEMSFTEQRIGHGIKVGTAQLEAQAATWHRHRARMMALLERQTRNGE